MSNSLKYILFSLMTLLLGVTVYLGYLYSVESKRLAKPQQTTLSGQVLPGYAIAEPVVNCRDQYYLVLGGRVIWLVKTGVAAYSYSQVEVSGSDRSKDNPCLKPDARYCGCDDYLVVDDIKVTTEGKAFAQEYFGEVFCASEGEDEEGKWCVHAFKSQDTGEVYTLTSLPGGPDLRGFIGGRVKALGILNNNKIDVFEIQKVE